MINAIPIKMTSMMLNMSLQNTPDVSGVPEGCLQSILYAGRALMNPTMSG